MLFSIFEEFEAYPFSDDPDFRAGLPTVIAAIRGKERSADQIDEMIGRAQWFYFTRLKGINTPWEEYTAYSVNALDPYKAALSSPASNHHGEPGTVTSPVPSSSRKMSDPIAVLNNLAEARKMMGGNTSTKQATGAGDGLSFAMLSRLIAEGRAGEIPVQHVPEGVHEMSPSQSQMRSRPKPWETGREPLSSSFATPFASPLPPQAVPSLYHASYSDQEVSPTATTPSLEHFQTANPALLSSSTNPYTYSDTMNPNLTLSADMLFNNLAFNSTSSTNDSPSPWIHADYRTEYLGLADGGDSDPMGFGFDFGFQSSTTNST